MLYFGLVELLLLDSSRELAEARRFRARVVADTLAENAAELAALKMVTDPKPMVPVNEETEQGTLSGKLLLTGDKAFELQGTGTSGGVDESTASVILRGRIDGNQVLIQYSYHRK